MVIMGHMGFGSGSGSFSRNGEAMTVYAAQTNERN
jgi:hypothetical protein